MQRPRVNLNAVADVLDRLLDHPLSAVAAELLPETHGALRRVRANLPDVASGLEAAAVDRIKQETRELEHELLDGMGRWVQSVIRTRRSPRPKVLKPKKAARRAGKR